jgi:hypothetical protein
MAGSALLKANNSGIVCQSEADANAHPVRAAQTIGKVHVPPMSPSTAHVSKEGTSNRAAAYGEWGRQNRSNAAARRMGRHKSHKIHELPAYHL